MEPIVKSDGLAKRQLSVKDAFAKRRTSVNDASGSVKKRRKLSVPGACLSVTSVSDPKCDAYCGGAPSRLKAGLHTISISAFHLFHEFLEQVEKDFRGRLIARLRPDGNFD